MSWLIMLFFGVVLVAAGFAIGYALATLRLARYKAAVDAAG
jgi:hypothetical protein